MSQPAGPKLPVAEHSQEAEGSPQPLPAAPETAGTPESPESPEPLEPPEAFSDLSVLSLAQAHALLCSFASFLTVAIHNVLFYRAIYPERTFLSAQAFNLPVHQSRHPVVCAWVRDAVDAVIAQIADGVVARVGVVIHAPPQRPQQRPQHQPSRPAKAEDAHAKPKPGVSRSKRGTAAASSAPSRSSPLARALLASSKEKGNDVSSAPGPAALARSHAPHASPAQPPRGDSSAVSAARPQPSPGAVLERWMFDVASFPPWPGGAEAMMNFGTAEAAPAPNKEGEEQGEVRQGVDNDDKDGPDEAEDLVLAEEEEEAEETGDEDSVSGSDEAAATTGDCDDALNWADVSEQLRGAVRRLAHVGEKLGSLPEGCTFTVAVELRDDAKPPIAHPQPWIPSEPKLQRPSRRRPGNGQDLNGTKTTPVRSVDAGPLPFECWVEEGKAKELLQKLEERPLTAKPSKVQQQQQKK